MKKVTKPMRSDEGSGHRFELLKEEIADNNMRHLVVRFPLQSGGTAEERINRGLLFEPQKAKVFFGSRGASLPDDCRHLFRHLQEARPKETCRVTSQAGWHDDDFVTRFGTFVGKGRAAVHVFDAGDPASMPRSSSGTHSQYVAGIAPFIEKSGFVLLGMLLGLLPSLAARIGRTSGFCVALCGSSSTGKTLTIQVAHSLLAKAAEESDLASFGDTMGTTLNLLPAAGGTCLGFADIKAETNMKEAMQKLRTVVFNGTSGKSRRRSTEAPRPDPQFLVPFVSAEHPLGDLFEEASLRFEAGDAVRTLTIPVPHGDDGGIFCNQILTPSTQLAGELENFLSREYGTVLPHWIKQLVHIDKERLSRAVAWQERQFLERVNSSAMPGHHARIAKRFALISAVGYIAVKARLVTSDLERVFKGIEALFWSTIHFLGNANDPQKLLWKQFFQQIEDDTILPLVHIGIPPVAFSELGFRRQEQIGERVYLRREELVKMLSPKFVGTHLIPALAGAGCLVRKKGEFTRIVAQVGFGRGRYYVLDQKLLTDLKASIVR